MRSLRETLASAASQFVACWRPLVLTDLVWKAAAFTLLTPLVGVLFRVVLAISGREVLADQDILLFALHPLGLAGAVLVGGLLLAIVALEQAALMAVLYADRAGRRLDAAGALRFALARAWPVLRLAARLTAAALAVAAPFLLALALTYYTLLRDYDINYFLRERPPAFLAALGIAAVIIAGLAASLLWLLTGWFYALPMVIFEDLTPLHAPAASRARARGRRRQVLAWVLGWGLAVAAVSAAATSATVWLARTVVPPTAGSIALLTLAIGVTLLVWGIVHLAINVLGAASAATIVFTLYRESAGCVAVDASRIVRFERESSGARLTLNGRRLLRWSVAGLLAAFLVGVIAIHTVNLPDTTRVAAHRGSSKAAPENTMAAFMQAIADGTDWIELDVQETADGDVVVFHDSDFMRQAGVDLKIWNATMADLQHIDIGSWFSPAFKNERVPTLASVLDACRGRTKLLIELKYYGHNQRLEERVAALVDERAMSSEVAIMSLDLDMVRKMKALRPGWKVGLLMSVAAGSLAASGADFLAVNAAFAGRPSVRAAHRRGEKFYVWTVDDPATISAMMGRGVDGVITNRPAVAKAVLAGRARLSPAVRVIIDLATVLGLKPDISGI